VFFCFSIGAKAAPPAATAAPAATPSSAGTAVSLIGRVLIRNEDKTGAQVRELKVGEPLYAGDVVNTRSDATVKLMMADKSIIDLGASTLFKVNEWALKHSDDRVVAMTLGYGKIRASVNTPVGPKGRFTIKTKAATMGVRGTEFIVSSELADPKAGAGKGAGKSVTTQITVVHGKVDFVDHAASSHNPIEITGGKQLTTVANLIGENTVQRSSASEAPPKVVDVPPAQLKTLIADAKVQDQTFKQAVIIDTSNKNQPSYGTSTMTSIIASAPPPPPVPQKPGDFGIPGTFQPMIPQIPVNVLPPGAPVTLQVTFVRH
jgi:hypothetical protein